MSPPVSPPPPPPPASFYRTDEFYRTLALSGIKAEYAYSRGGTGSGVVISVHDIGIADPNSSELAGKVLNSAELINPADNYRVHAQQVAETAVGIKNDSGAHGVAFDSNLVISGGSVKSYQTFMDLYELEQRYGARISNHSYTFRGISSEAAYGNFGAPFVMGAKAGRVYVIAAGNNPNTTDPNPGLPYFPQFNKDLLGHWVVVTGLLGDDSQGQMPAADDNPCGATADWCIAAPFQNYHGYGTSFSAPTVSGSLAVMMELFPTLSTKMIVERLFASADKSGIYANKSLYGNGRLDLERATQPIGGLSVPNGSTTATPLAEAKVQEGSISGDSLARALDNKTVVLKDSLDAPFTLPATVLTASEKNRNSSGLTHITRLTQNQSVRSVALGAFQLRYSDGNNSTFINGSNIVELAMPLSTDVIGFASINSQNGFAQGLNYLAPSIAETSLSGAGADPFGALNQSSKMIGARWKFMEDLSIAMSVGESEQEIDPPKNGNRRGKPNRGYKVEATYITKNSNFGISADFGSFVESQQLLGTRGELAFNNSESESFSGGVNAIWSVTDNSSIYAGYHLSKTVTASAAAGSFAKVYSNSFSVGALTKLSRSTTAIASVTQPLRLSSGKLDVYLPSTLNSDNTVQLEKHSLGLTPSGRQLDYEISATHAFEKRNIELRGGIQYSRDNGNINGNNDFSISAGINWNF